MSSSPGRSPNPRKWNKVFMSDFASDAIRPALTYGSFHRRMPPVTRMPSIQQKPAVLLSYNYMKQKTCQLLNRSLSPFSRQIHVSFIPFLSHYSGLMGSLVRLGLIQTPILPFPTPISPLRLSSSKIVRMAYLRQVLPTLLQVKADAAASCRLSLFAKGAHRLQHQVRLQRRPSAPNSGPRSRVKPSIPSFM